LKTGDCRFSYEAAGDPALPPLVFLHGIGGAARGWRVQLEAFSDRYRTIAWDMPGYGGSRWRTRCRTSCGRSAPKSRSWSGIPSAA
jgi:pimeloyl-ACP methyl ester carboxylesterase